jgi:hypothetical protein
MSIKPRSRHNRPVPGGVLDFDIPVISLVEQVIKATESNDDADTSESPVSDGPGSDPNGPSDGSKLKKPRRGLFLFPISGDADLGLDLKYDAGKSGPGSPSPLGGDSPEGIGDHRIQGELTVYF